MQPEVKIEKIVRIEKLNRKNWIVASRDNLIFFFATKLVAQKKEQRLKFIVEQNADTSIPRREGIQSLYEMCMASDIFSNFPFCFDHIDEY